MSLSNITHVLARSSITTATSPITVSQSLASASPGSKAPRPRVRLAGHKVIVCTIFFNETRPLRRLCVIATYSSCLHDYILSHGQILDDDSARCQPLESLLSPACCTVTGRGPPWRHAREQGLHDTGIAGFVKPNAARPATGTGQRELSWRQNPRPDRI